MNVEPYRVVIGLKGAALAGMLLPFYATSIASLLALSAVGVAGAK